MAITYPLAFPTVTTPARVMLSARDVVAVSASPFTGQVQTFSHAAQWWEADVTLPAMKAASAEQWIAFLLSLRGRKGTFLMGDPARATPQGTAATYPGSPKILLGGQTGGTINIDGLPTTSPGYLLAGDYVQFGSGSTATLHKVLTDVTGVAGAASIEIWPNVRSSPTDNSAVVVSNAKGLFRRADNQQSWDINEASIYGLTFGAVEAL